MKSKRFKVSLIIASIFLMLLPSTAFAELASFEITIKDHTFSPVELTVPANEKVKLIVENQDATPEEFESYDLNREKIVTAHGKITVFVGPLKPGTYKYFGEFHQKTAQGTIIAQ